MFNTDKLHAYSSGRNFEKTSEPNNQSSSTGGKPVFVIQKHDAGQLHYDFRLEMRGVLVSWAVPKGLSTDPREKRLAIRTEDHPLAYAHFEGNIPKDQYGGGTVLIWDRGTYENITNKEGKQQSLEDSMSAGHFLVRLQGQKLKGGYALTRIRKQQEEQWLIVKMKDKEADARRNPISSQAKSVVSHKTLKQIKEGKNK